MLNHPALYDTNKTYEQNIQDGPPFLHKKQKIKTRKKIKQVTHFGMKLNSSFGISAGPLFHSQFIKLAFDLGFDINVYKTQRSVSFKSNSFPNILPLNIKGKLSITQANHGIKVREKFPNRISQLSITNSFGNPSHGPEFWVPDLSKALLSEQKGQLLIMSVVGTLQDKFSAEDYFKDFAYTASLAHKTGVKAIEINLSCPNVKGEGVLCFNIEAVENICKKVKNVLGNTPLIIKLGYFDTSQNELLEKLLSKITPYIHAISAINTLPAKIITQTGENAFPNDHGTTSGVCGGSIQWAGLSMVKKLHRIRKNNMYNFSIIGIGGVLTEDDYTLYRTSGADIVKSSTGAIWDPELAYKIWRKTNYDS